MYGSMKIAAVVPARNEERLIGRTIWPVPESVDTIYVIDDGSQDQTEEMVLHYAKNDSRIRLIKHRTNKGVGAAIITGYRQAYNDDHDVFVVVGGDAQMDWGDLNNLLKPIADNKADYTKGNRFIYGRSKESPGNAWREMPTLRILGNVTLSIFTKIASGYYHINDSQMGYTALHRRAFDRVDWNRARKGYGYPAEWLMRFHSRGIRVVDVPVRAIYLKNERQSQIHLRKFLFYMSGVIVRGGMNRIFREYMAGRMKLPRIPMHTIRVAFNNLYERLSPLIRGASRISQRIGQAAAQVRSSSLLHAMGFSGSTSQAETSSTPIELYGPRLNCLSNVAEIMSKAAKMIVENSVSFDYVNHPQYFKDNVLSILFTEASVRLNFRERTDAIVRNARRLLQGTEQTNETDTKLPSSLLSIRQELLHRLKSGGPD